MLIWSRRAVRVLGVWIHPSARGPVDRPFDRLRVRVDQQLRRVEAETVIGRVGAVEPVAVAPARADLGHVAVPVERVALGQLDAGLRSSIIEQAQLDLLGVL